MPPKARGVKDKRNETRRDRARRENPPEVEKLLGTVLPEAQVRGDDRREKDRRDEPDEANG